MTSNQTEERSEKVTEVVSEGANTAPRCPSCDAETYRRHCKYVCPAHGVVMDCGDTFW